MPGVDGSASILMGKRSVLEYVLEPIFASFKGALSEWKIRLKYSLCNIITLTAKHLITAKWEPDQVITTLAAAAIVSAVIEDNIAVISKITLLDICFWLDIDLTVIEHVSVTGNA